LVIINNDYFSFLQKTLIIWFYYEKIRQADFLDRICRINKIIL